MTNSSVCGVVLVTAASQQQAEEIAGVVVEAKLAACVNIFPIQSIYRWEGKLHNHQEWQLLMKTDLKVFPVLEAKIREIHSYQVPEIIALPITCGYEPYLQWIFAQVG